MKDYVAATEKLRREAAEAGLIRDLATDPKKRDTFDRLSRHLTQLADEIERATPQNSEARPLDGFTDQANE